MPANLPSVQDMRAMLAEGGFEPVEADSGGGGASGGWEVVPTRGPDLRQSWALTRDADPDDLAERRRLAREMGLDATTARTMDLREMRMRADLGDDFDALQAEAPGLFEWASRPENLAVARDDMGTLRAVEGEIRQGELNYFGHQLREGAKDVSRSMVGWAKGLADYFREIDLRALAAMPEDRRAAELERRAGLGGLAKAFVIGPEELDGVGDWAEQALADEKLQRLDFPRREGAAGYWDDVVRMAPQLFTQVYASMAGGPLAGMGVMGAQIGGGQYLEQERKGIDPVRNFQASLANAAMQAPLEQIGIGRALKVWQPGAGIGRVFRGFLEGGLGESVTEWMQKYPEAASEIWAEAEQKGQTPQEQVDEFFNRLGEITAQGMYEGLVALPYGGFFGGVNAAAQTSMEMQKAEDLRRYLDALAGLAKVSRLAARDDERFADFVDRVSAEQGFTHVHVPADAVAQYAQEAGVDDEAWIEDFDVDWRAVAEARITGATVPLSVGKVVAKMGEDEVLQALRPHMRRDPGDMAEATMEEEIADEREAHALLEEMYRAEERRMAAPEHVAALRDQLVEAGHDREQAKMQVALLEHRANTWARRSGQSAQQWFERKGIRFERRSGGGAEGGYAQDFGQPVVVASREHWPDAPRDVLRREANEFYRTQLQGTTVHHPQLGDVRFVSKGRKKSTRGFSDVRRHRLVPHLPEIIARGTVLYTERDIKRDRKSKTNVAAYHYLENMVDFDGEMLAVVVLVEEDEQGGLHYNHWLADNKQDPEGTSAPQGGELSPALLSGSLTSSATTLADSDIRNIFSDTGGVNLAIREEGAAVRAVREAVAPLQAAARGALPLRVVETRGQLPPAALDAAGGEAVRGAMADGAVWLVADAIADADEAVRAWRHEQGLHVGIRGLFGLRPGGPQDADAAARLDGFLDDVFAHFGGESFAQYREAYGLDFSNTEHRRIAAEERLARIAERLDLGEDLDADERSAWDAFVEFLRGLARELGVEVSLSDAEIVGTVKAAMRWTMGDDGQGGGYSQSDRARVLFNEGETVVLLFDGANLSSVLHESGHIFLQDLAESAAEGFEVETFAGAKAWFGRNAGRVVDELRAAESAAKRRYNAAEGPDEKMLRRVELDVAHVALRGVLDRGGAVYVADVARGLEDFRSGDEVEVAVKTRFHEMFARGFEAWLREGTAPSVDLQGAFARFRQWLVRLYRSVLDLGVDLDDEVRSVFARMLTTEEQIETARQVRGAVRMFEGLDPGDGGFTPADMEEYRRLADEAQAKAAASLEREKNRERNAMLRAWRDEIEAEVDERRGVKLVRWLSRGDGPRVPRERAEAMEADGRGAKEIMDATGWFRRESGRWGHENEGGPGLNKADFLIRYSEQDVERLPRTVPPILRENGLPLDLAAVEAGYETADEMLEDIFDMRPRGEIVREMLEQRVAAADAGVDPEAHVHNEDYARLLELESEALARLAGGGADRIMRAKALRSWAEAQTAQADLRAARDVAGLLADAKRQRQSAVRAQREGRYDEAFAANERLRRVEALLSVRYRVREEIPLIERRVRRLAGRKMTMPHREQILGLLERYGLGSPTMRPAEPEAREPLFRFLAPGGDGMMDARPDFPDWLLGEQRAGDYHRGFTLEDLRDVDRLVRYLAARGAAASDEAVSRDRVRISKRADLQAETMREMGDKKVWERGSVMRKLTAPGRKWLPEISNQLYMMKMADGYTNHGPDGVLGPNEEMAGWLVEAGNEEKRLWAEFGPAMQPLLDHFSRRVAASSRRLDVNVPVTEAMRRHGINAWDMRMVFAAALNCGNNGNVLAMVDGYGLVRREDVDAALKQAKGMRLGREEMKRRVTAVKIRLGWVRLRTLFEQAGVTNEDWRVVQQVWDLIDKAYPVLDATYRKLNGIPLKKVPARPFMAPSGSGVQLEGGYYPLKFDGRFADNVRTWQEVEDWLDGEGQFQTPAARSGFVNERMGSSLPPKLDLGVISEHLADVLHYATHAPVLKDVDRITRDKKWADEYKRVFGVEAYAQVRPWLKGIARRERPPAGQFHQLVEEHRRLATIAILGLNASVALKQPFSLFGAANEMGWGPMLAGVGSAVRGRGEMVNQVNELSVYMAQRSKAWDREVQAALARSDVDKRSVWIKGKEYSWRDVQDFSFVLIRVMDAATVYPIWSGAHAKAVGEGMAPDEAVAYADRIVRDTQPSADAVDLVAWQRGHGVYRLFSMFMTFTLKWGQRQRFYLGGWRRGKISTRRMLRHMAYEWLLPPLVMSFMISMLRTGEPPEPEELLAELVGYQVAGYPILNQVMGAVQYNRGMMESPASRGVDILWNAARKGFEASRGEVDEKTFWALAEALSYSSGLPVSKVVKTAKEGLGSENPFNLIVTNPKRR